MSAAQTSSSDVARKRHKPTDDCTTDDAAVPSLPSVNELAENLAKWQKYENDLKQALKRAKLERILSVEPRLERTQRPGLCTEDMKTHIRIIEACVKAGLEYKLGCKDISIDRFLLCEWDALEIFSDNKTKTNFSVCELDPDTHYWAKVLGWSVFFERNITTQQPELVFLPYNGPVLHPSGSWIE
jgi:hypothetical protein